MGLFSSDPEEVEITLVGSVPRDRGLTVASAIEDHFEVTATVGDRLSTFETLHGLDGTFSPGRDAYDAERDQYDADEFALWRPEDLVHVWLTDHDLYTSQDENRDYVFGLALIGDRSCIVSTARLADGEPRTPSEEERNFDGDDRFSDEENWHAVAEERLRKQALKQVGRALGAERCISTACALYPAFIPSDLDRIQESICEDCAGAIGSDLVR